MTAKARTSMRKGNGRVLTDITLHEVSLVAMPANQSARITSARSAFMQGDVANRTDLERLLFDRLRGDGLTRNQVKALLSQGYAGLLTDADELMESIQRARAALGP